MIDLAAIGQVLERHLHEHHHRLALHVGSWTNWAWAHSSMSSVTLVTRPKAAPLDEDRFLVEHFSAALHYLAIRREHRRTGQTLLDQLQRHQPIVHLIKPGAGKP